MPAMPHITLDTLPNSISARYGTEQFELVVTKVTRVSFPTVACRENHIHHLTRRDDVHMELDSAHLFAQIAEEVLYGASQHRSFVTWIHAVTMKFYKRPTRPSLYCYCSSFPKL